MKSPRKHASPADIDAYLAKVPAEPRAALQKLRQTIQAAAPKATEKLSYQIPTFDYLGSLVAFAAFKHHCSFFPMSLSVIAAHQSELRDHDVSKGTIRFTAARPLPAGLVKKMVRERMKQNQARARKRQLKKRPAA